MLTSDIAVGTHLLHIAESSPYRLYTRLVVKAIDEPVDVRFVVANTKLGTQSTYARLIDATVHMSNVTGFTESELMFGGELNHLLYAEYTGMGVGVALHLCLQFDNEDQLPVTVWTVRHDDKPIVSTITLLNAVYYYMEESARRSIR